jgi:hypothetical protein
LFEFVLHWLTTDLVPLSGVDATHNPEFTTVEVYQAYSDYSQMMTFTEEARSADDILHFALRNVFSFLSHSQVLRHVVRGVTGGSLEVSQGELSPPLDFAAPFQYEGIFFLPADRSLSTSFVVLSWNIVLLSLSPFSVFLVYNENIFPPCSSPGPLPGRFFFSIRRFSFLETIEQQSGYKLPREFSSERSLAQLREVADRCNVVCAPWVSGREG